MKTPKVKAQVKLTLKPLEFEFDMKEGDINELFANIGEELEHTGLEVEDFERSFECTITHPSGTVINHILSFPQPKKVKKAKR